MSADINCEWPLRYKPYGLQVTSLVRHHTNSIHVNESRSESVVGGHECVHEDVDEVAVFGISCMVAGWYAQILNDHWQTIWVCQRVHSEGVVAQCEANGVFDQCYRLVQVYKKAQSHKLNVNLAVRLPIKYQKSRSLFLIFNFNEDFSSIIPNYIWLKML